MHKWILCKNKLPRNAKIVLVTDGVGVGLGFMGMHGSKRDKNDPQFFRPVLNDPIANVFAWQDLPKPLRLRKKRVKLIDE